MKMELYRSIAITAILFVFLHIQPLSGANSDRILLTEVKALTLHGEEMTNFRRTSPVPQITCVGGSAAGAFKPKTVQCINRGSDGYDVQWECKTDMDNSYRFGQIEVTCEGYDYPEDPYILRGSCGLEYTLEFTEEGWARKKALEQEKYSAGNQYSHNSNEEKGSFVKKLIFLFIIAVITYTIYKKCIAKPNITPNVRPENPPSYEEAMGARDNHGNTQQPSAPPPPPPGFRPEYIPNTEEDLPSSEYQPHYQSVPQSPPSTWFSSPKPSTTTKQPEPTKIETTTNSTPQSSGNGTTSGFGSTTRREHTPTTTPPAPAKESPRTPTAPPIAVTRVESGFASTCNREHSQRASPPTPSKESPSTPSAPPSTGTRTASGFGGTKRR